MISLKLDLNNEIEHLLLPKLRILKILISFKYYQKYTSILNLNSYPIDPISFTLILMDAPHLPIQLSLRLSSLGDYFCSFTILSVPIHIPSNPLRDPHNVSVNHLNPVYSLILLLKIFKILGHILQIKVSSFQSLHLFIPPHVLISLYSISLFNHSNNIHNQMYQLRQSIYRNQKARTLAESRKLQRMSNLQSIVQPSDVIQALKKFKDNCDSNSTSRIHSDIRYLADISFTFDNSLVRSEIESQRIIENLIWVYDQSLDQDIKTSIQRLLSKINQETFFSTGTDQGTGSIL